MLKLFACISILLSSPPVINTLPELRLPNTAVSPVKLVNTPVDGIALPIGVSFMLAANRLPDIPAPPLTINAPELTESLTVVELIVKPELVVVVTIAPTFTSPMIVRRTVPGMAVPIIKLPPTPGVAGSPCAYKYVSSAKPAVPIPLV